LSRLYNDPEVDIVIALGFGSAAVAVSLEEYPKPTLASVIFNPHLVNAPIKGNSSGKHNLAYISIQADLATELKVFREVVDFTNIALLSDSLKMEVMPALATEGARVATEMGIKIFPVLHSGKGDDLVSRLPSETDAVMIGALPRMDETQTAKLLSDLIELGLPSYSLTGSHLVEQGALATAAPPEDWQRRTRRLVLDLQAVLFGDDPKDMKVFVEDRRRLITKEGLDRSPEIASLLAKIIAQERIPKSEKRSFWLPTISLIPSLSCPAPCVKENILYFENYGRQCSLLRNSHNGYRNSEQ